MPDAREALDELLEMSASVRAAVLVRGADQVLASTYDGGGGESAVVQGARAILEDARSEAREMGRPPLSQLFIQTRSGCLFIVAGGEDTWLAATTGPDPTVGLVLYDVNTALKTALEGEAAGDDAEEEEDG
jgi:predicted regulator of Ras-like GTPase activity (Roadblock/LC7/MglB family)